MTQDKTGLLVQAVQRLSIARDIQSIMNIVREVARKLTLADGATFILREEDKCFYAEENAISPLWKGQRFPMKACISGWAMIHKKPVVIEDIYQDDRIPVDAYRPTFVKSLAMVPIRTMDPIGAIGNYWAEKRMPSEEDIFLLQSLADITSVSIENVYAYAELEKRVKERTKQLEDANKTLQTFNYSVSHDLKAPLRAIYGYSRALIEDESGISEDGKKLLGKIESCATNMNELLMGLLDFSKIGGKELIFREVAMADMVKEICDSIKEQEKNRNISFTISDLPPANGDPLLIRQVWFNLISNAVKYTGKKQESKIEIGVQLLKDERVYFIKDNGAGFDMQYYNKLFDIFQRLHSKTEFDGHGIGLTLVEKIISRHNGRIWAEAKPGEGAVFYFSLHAD